jgi:hypothetical protein
LLRGHVFLSLRGLALGAIVFLICSLIVDIFSFEIEPFDRSFLAHLQHKLQVTELLHIVLALNLLVKQAHRHSWLELIKTTRLNLAW